jgi:hypothetical protein
MEAFTLTTIYLLAVYFTVLVVVGIVAAIRFALSYLYVVLIMERKRY